MTEHRLREFAERYIAVWNEPDRGARRKAVEGLWAEDALQVLQPPQEMKEEAARIGMRDVVLEARGHDALEFRVARAYEEFIAPGGRVFRCRGEAERLHDVVRLGWEMASSADGSVLGGGTQVLRLGQDGRIVSEYQFSGV